MTKEWDTNYSRYNQTPFCRWVRENKSLDSARGYSRVDSDHIFYHFWHLYRLPNEQFGNRTTNRIMLIEEKTNGAELPIYDKDCIFIVDQMMQCAHHTSVKTARGEEVIIEWGGYHTLVYDITEFRYDETVKWDSKEIPVWQLEEILSMNDL